jgi:uncharacterized protein (DUF2062 family)
MPKKFLKRISPNPETLKSHKHFQWLGELLHNPNLWHFNRRAISGALALGLFCAFIPVPWQMVLAGLGAIYFHVNMPVSVITVWVSNPLTMGPMFYGCYLVGAWFLNTPPSPFEFELSWDWLSNSLLAIWQPFLLGCFIVGTLASITGYITIRIIWRVAAIRKWQKRNKSMIAR